MDDFVLKKPNSKSLSLVLSKLQEEFGNSFTRNENICLNHGKDEAYHPVAPPDAVIFPKNSNDIKKIVDLCSEYEVPIVPYGVGTSLEGGVCALSGGICVDFSEMNKIINVNVFKKC